MRTTAHHSTGQGTKTIYTHRTSIWTECSALPPIRCFILPKRIKTDRQTDRQKYAYSHTRRHTRHTPRHLYSNLSFIRQQDILRSEIIHKAKTEEHHIDAHTHNSFSSIRSRSCSCRFTMITRIIWSTMQHQYFLVSCLQF